MMLPCIATSYKSAQYQHTNVCRTRCAEITTSSTIQMSTLGFLRCAKNIETVAPVLHIVRLILTNSTTPDTRQSMVISQSLTLAVLMAILPGEPEIAGFIEAKDEKTGCDK